MAYIKPNLKPQPRKPTVPSVFEYKDCSKEEMANIIDEKVSINIENMSDIIDRVHQRYPLISKDQISLIVLQTIKTMRQLLVKGYIITISGVFKDLKLDFYQHIYKDVYYPVARVVSKFDRKLKRKIDAK